MVAAVLQKGNIMRRKKNREKLEKQDQLVLDFPRLLQVDGKDQNVLDLPRLLAPMLSCFKGTVCFLLPCL